MLGDSSTILSRVQSPTQKKQGIRPKKVTIMKRKILLCIKQMILPKATIQLLLRRPRQLTLTKISTKHCQPPSRPPLQGEKDLLQDALLIWILTQNKYSLSSNKFMIISLIEYCRFASLRVHFSLLNPTLGIFLKKNFTQVEAQTFKP